VMQESFVRETAANVAGNTGGERLLRGRVRLALMRRIAAKRIYLGGAMQSYDIVDWGKPLE